MISWTIREEHAGLSIRSYLRTVHKFSRRLLTSIINEGGCIEVNGKEQTVKYLLRAGDELKLTFPPEKKNKYMIPENIPLDIIYEDNDLLVINKPPHVVTMPSLNHPTGTIAHGLLAYYEKHQIPYTIHIVTRLDRDTSGLMLVAKHRYCHSLLSFAQQSGQIYRTYKAIVHGHLQQTSGTINAPIGRKEGSIIERTVTQSGKKAITHYNVTEELNDYSLLHIELETGRTHQIRVHFSHVGHPLVGDDLYGGSKKYMKRQALHCYKLSFIHPITHVRKTFCIPPPHDMKQFITRHL